MRRPFAFALLATSVTACGALIGAQAGEPADGADAAPDAPGAPPPEGPDAPLAGDGGDAAADAPTEAASTFCQTATHLFCADFDEGSSPWGFDGTQIVPSSAGASVVTTAGGTSPPNAMLATVLAGSRQAAVALTKPLPASRHVRWGYAIRLVGLAAVDDIQVSNIGFSTNRAVELRVDNASGTFTTSGQAPAKLYVSDASSSAATALSVPLGNVFRRVVLDVDFQTGVVSVDVDGATAIASAAAPQATAADTTFVPGAGIYMVSVGGADTQVEYDDVTLDAL